MFIRPLLALLASTLMLSGCIKVDQTLSLRGDGSGTLDMRYGMSEQTIAQLEAMEQMAAGMKQQGMEVEMESDSPFDFDEAQIRKEFADKKLDGIELLDVDSETKDGWRYMMVRLAFDDLQSLNRTEFYEDGGLRISRNAAGDYVLEQDLGDKDAGMPGAGGGADMDAAMPEGMAAMFAGLRIAMTFEVPGEVKQSNASKVEGNRASWIYDIAEDPRAFEKLEREHIHLVFSGEGLDIPLGQAKED